MESESPLHPRGFEQALLNIVRALPTHQQVQLLDYALLMRERLIGTAEAKPVIHAEELDEHIWGRSAVRSLAKHWNTPEEDEAWIDERIIEYKAGRLKREKVDEVTSKIVALLTS